ncbi:MAG: ABC transporter substrate-binding protein [Microbacteriaceae bacterium]|nr:MAG: ABC transporter substrate-binding protein [Microbacteriaceae bacterium]
MTRLRSVRLSGRRPLMGLGLIAVLALTACTGTGETNSHSNSSQASNQSVVYSHSGALASLDPVHADFSETASVDQALYDTLISYDQKNEIVPELARSYKVAADVLSISVTLRSGVIFHDGSRVTAKDVAYTLNRDVKLAVGVASTLSDYASTHVVDPTHLVIHLKRPSTLFLGALSNIYIVESRLVSAHQGTDDGQAWLNKNDAGSGPYTLSSVSTTQVITKRYPKYWAFNSHRPAKFMFLESDQASTTAASIKAGNVSIGKIDTTSAATLKGQRGITLKKLRDGAQVYIYFNTSQGPTSNIAVRKAVRLAYDYNAGLEKIRQGLGIIATGPLPSSVSCRPPEPPSKQNLAEAKKVLKDAGISNLTLTLGYQPNSAKNAQEATLLQSDLKGIGVDLKLTPMQFPAYLQSLSSFSTIPEMFLAADAPPYPGAGTMLSTLYLSTAVGSNRTGFSDPTFDSLVNRALKTSDEKTQCQLYEQAQLILAKEMPAADLYESADIWAYDSNLGNSVQVNPVHGTLDVKAVEFAKK